MYTLDSPYVSENPIDSGVLGVSEISNYAMSYSANESCCRLRVVKGIKVESYLHLF